jgi:lysophospholipase L1-like esterase
VLHLGDSHVGAEAFSTAMRSYFAGKSGPAEVELLLPDLLPQGGGRSGGLTLDRTWKVVHSRTAPAGDSGLAGGWAETSARGASIRIRGRFGSAKVLLLRQTGGGSASVRLDSRSSGAVRLAGQPGVEVVRLAASPGDHEVEVVADGDGPVRFLGALLEPGKGGAAYLPVGVNGALASMLLRIPEPILAAQLAAIDPDLVIVAFGTNEARTFGVERGPLADQMATLVSRIRRAAPRAAVVVVGPPDQGRRTASGAAAAVPARETVSRAFADAARREEATFVDLAAGMGGPGSIRTWKEERPSLVQEDLVHFTKAGYLRLARILSGALDGRETMDRRPTAFAASSGDVRFERDASGRVRLTNLPPGQVPAPILGTARTPR